MEAKTTGNEHLDPHGEDESVLVGMFFQRITEIFPEWPMGDRTDLAMTMLAVVKTWAHNLELTNDSHSVVDLVQPRPMFTEDVDEGIN